MASENIIRFTGGDSGEWAVRSITAVTGDSLPAASHMAVRIGAAPVPDAAWDLAGAISNLRYTTAGERTDLRASQSGLGRSEARHAALIPISKSQDWWDLAQDERLAIYRAAQHTPIGMEYLPEIARRLHHGRDLGETFDFLTWFEYAPEHEAAFDKLLLRLRASEEWRYVSREVDIRLVRSDG